MNHISNLARLQAAAAQYLRDNRPFPTDRMSESLAAYADAHPDDPEVTDDEITEWGAEMGLDKSALIVRLRKYIADSEIGA